MKDMNKVNEDTNARAEMIEEEMRQKAGVSKKAVRFEFRRVNRRCMARQIQINLDGGIRAKGIQIFTFIENRRKEF